MPWRSYGYDDELRLTRSVSDTGGLFGTDTETFSLDAVGNRTAHSRVTGAWATDANQRLTRRGEGANATSYEYDEAGNLTQKTEPGGRVTLFAYDAHQRLAEVRTGAGQTVARYGYDPQHRRIWKEQFRSRDGSALNPARRSYYLYADDGLIAEAQQDVALNADGGVSALSEPTITTQYAPMPGAPFTTGVLVVKTRNSAGETVVAYLQHDHLKTPVQVIDKSGRVVWAASYEPFGRASVMTAPATDAPTIDLALRLPGQIEDAETGLHYNWHRYYDPETGRYVTRDPIGLAGGINTYSYVNGNPIKRIDPDGLWAIPMPMPVVVPLLPPWVIPVAAVAWLGWEVGHWIFNKPPRDAEDRDGAKAPGRPGADEGFCEPKKGKPKWGRAPNGRGSGWIDSDGNVWVPTGPDSGSTGDAHGGPHWDVQRPDGGYDNVYPGGKRR